MLQTDGLTDRRTFAILESLSRLKKQDTRLQGQATRTVKQKRQVQDRDKTEFRQGQGRNKKGIRQE